MAVSGVLSDGFQSTQSPQTAAMSAFQDHTATGKLKAEITPDQAERMPLFVHAVPRPLAGHGESIELARKPDGEIGDVDHLLDFAFAFGQDLAHFERDQRAEVILEAAQLVADFTDDLAALRSGQHRQRWKTSSDSVTTRS